MPDALPPALQATLAAHLADRNDPAKACDAAKQLAVHQQWRQAAAIMQHVLTLGAPSLIDMVSYARYLACCGEVDAARQFVQGLGRGLSSLAGAQRETVQNLARDFFGEAAMAFAAGRQAEAEIIADIFLNHHPFGRRLLGVEVPADELARPSVLEDSVVEAFIRRTIEESAAGRLAPPGKGAARAACEQAIAPHRGRRLLIIHRERYHPSKRSDRTPTPDYFLESALEAGLDARVIRSDFACSVPASAHPPTAAAEQEEIRRTIETWQPEVVVCDAFGGAGRESITDCIRELRRRQGFRLIGLFHDVWSDSIRGHIADVEGDLDAVWFFDPLATSPHTRSIARGVSTVPPIPERPFREARRRTPQTRELGFIGGMAYSNHIRGVWLAEMRRRGIPIDIVIGFPYSDPAYRTIDAFAGFVASCKVSLCICGRNAVDAAIPSRVWEGVLAGSVLLEDDSRHLRHLLTPFAHYVPFRTIEELAYYAGFLARRDDIRQAIADHALAFVRETYSAAGIWHAVLETAAGRSPHRFD